MSKECKFSKEIYIFQSSIYGIYLKFPGCMVYDNDYSFFFLTSSHCQYNLIFRVILSPLMGLRSRLRLLGSNHPGQTSATGRCLCTELNGLVKHCGSYCQREGVMDAKKKSCLKLEAKTLQLPFSLGPNVLV